MLESPVLHLDRLRYTVKRLIGYQTSGKEKAPPLRVSFIIHGKQMKLVQGEQSIINERRWERSKERDGVEELRG